MKSRFRWVVVAVTLVVGLLPMAASASTGPDPVLRQEYNDCRAQVNAAWLAASPKYIRDYSACDAYRP